MLDSIQFIFLNTIMSLLSAFIVYYLLSKKAEKTIDFYKNMLKNDAEKWLNSEVGAKALYSLGMLIGQGAKDSIGVGTKGGKFKWQDLAVQVGLEWAKKSLPGLIPEPGQNLNIKSEETTKRTKFGSA